MKVTFENSGEKSRGAVVWNVCLDGVAIATLSKKKSVEGDSFWRYERVFDAQAEENAPILEELEGATDLHLAQMRTLVRDVIEWDDVFSDHSPDLLHYVRYRNSGLRELKKDLEAIRQGHETFLEGDQD